MPALLNFR